MKHSGFRYKSNEVHIFLGGQFEKRCHEKSDSKRLIEIKKVTLNLLLKPKAIFLIENYFFALRSVKFELISFYGALASH